MTNYKFEVNGDSTDMQLNNKAMDIADQFDLSDKQRIKLEMDIVRLAWSYHRTKNERCE